MNDATSLLNLPSEQDPRLHPRNRCIHEGFQSIALIPIRVEREIVGLLQLNDRRKNCFTLEMIRYLEGLAASFGVALLRLKEEQAVRASEERFAGIFYNSPAAIGISRLSDGVFLDVNEAFTRLYGYTREELVGHTSADLSLWYSPGRAQLISELQQKNSLQNVGIQVRRKDGEVRDLLASLQLVDLAGDQCILGIMADVTERKRAEAALEESEARYRLVSENSSDVIWLFNTEANRFSFVSPSVERLRGFTVEEVMRQTFEEVLTPESHRIVMDGMPRRLAAFAAGEESAQSMTQEVLQVCKDGTSVPTEVVTTLIADAQGRVTHIQGVARDITVRKRLEAQVRQGQKLEAIGQLAGGIAHDFNNILAATMMRVDLMRMKKGLNPEILQGLKDLESEMRRAADLTKQLLMFGRQSVLAVKPLDLNDVTVNIMRMLSRLIGEHIDLRFEGKAALPCVKADAGMLEQVIINLAVNARDAMPNGGRITIGTSVATLSEEQVRGSNERRPGEFLCLTVSDTGCGMDAETLKRIFDPFFTTKEQGKGTGLGLATVDGIVAQHKGWVEVESTVGQGTTFRVFLPAIAGKAEEIEAQSRETEPAPGGKESLLVVEDDRALRMLIVQLLRSWGYRVFEASTGQEALTLWQSQSSNIDLILTDMVMPEGMTGLELVESLRSRKPGLKAIISSGYSSDIVQAGLPTKAGIVFLPKPYEAKLLAKVVRECLDPKS
jgi:PAS domain S-box-containing protein